MNISPFIYQSSCQWPVRWFSVVCYFELLRRAFLHVSHGFILTGGFVGSQGHRCSGLRENVKLFWKWLYHPLYHSQFLLHYGLWRHPALERQALPPLHPHSRPPRSAYSPLFSCLSSSCSRSVCRLPKTKAKKERMRALRMPIMARMYAQRTEQSPREYFPVLAPHMSRIVSESQPSGKIMQPSTRHRAEESKDQPPLPSGRRREGDDYSPEPKGSQGALLRLDPTLCPSTQEPVNHVLWVPETLGPGLASCPGEQKLLGTHNALSQNHQINSYSRKPSWKYEKIANYSHLLQLPLESWPGLPSPILISMYGAIFLSVKMLETSSYSALHSENRVGWEWWDLSLVRSLTQCATLVVPLVCVCMMEIRVLTSQGGYQD